MIEVRIAGKGRAVGDDVTEDAGTTARCDLCGRDVDLVTSLTEGLFACRDCLRDRLDASSVASWRFREGGGGLPWGKIAG